MNLDKPKSSVSINTVPLKNQADRNRNSSYENQQPATPVARRPKPKITPTAIRVILISSNLLELGLSLLAFISVWLSYPFGFLGDTSPTTIEDVSRSLTVAIASGLFVIFSFLYVRYIKFFSELYHTVKIPLYLYAVYNLIRLLLTFSSEVPSLDIDQIATLPLTVALLCIPISYCLLSSIIIIYNYKLLRSAQKSVRREVLIVTTLLSITLLGAIFSFRWLVSTIEQGGQEARERSKQRSLDFKEQLREQQEERGKEVEATFPTSADMQKVQRVASVDRTGWKTYNISSLGCLLKYPNTFERGELKKGHSHSNYISFFRLNDQSSRRGFVSLEYDEGYKKFDNSDEAIDFVLLKIKPEFKTFSRKLNETIETSVSSQGWNLFFVEFGSGPNWMEGEYENIYIVVERPDQRCLLWKGYTNFDGGLEILKQITESIEEVG